jgi:hypothetical protein
LTADIAGESRLCEGQSLGIRAPHEHSQVGFGTRLSPAVNCHEGILQLSCWRNDRLFRGIEAVTVYQPDAKR